MIIKTSKQLKDKISNIAGKNGKKAQLLIRKYIMECFLVRLANSEYKNNFILKGGMLVSAIVGVESRTTMDIDTTVKSLPLTKENVTEVINQILKVKVDDCLIFKITKIEEIMEEHDYSGIRFTIEAMLENLKDTIKIDISTGDEIIPSAIELFYPRMFNNEKIQILSYNIETMLAEKLETVVARTIFNTRMRDFYDIHVLWLEKKEYINIKTLNNAIISVANRRKTINLFKNLNEILQDVKNSDNLRTNWNNYKKSNFYVGEISWDNVIETTLNIFKNLELE